MTPRARPAPSLVGAPTAAPVDDPLDRRLDRAWRDAWLARVGDHELSAGVDALFCEALASGFATKASPGPLLRGLSADRRLEVQLTPGRAGYKKAVDLARKTGTPAPCPFCKPPDARQRALAWRGNRVFVNPFPYSTDGGPHLVLTSDDHQKQRFSARMFDDAIRMQELLGGATLHYNGLAGNSQEHLHWHATRETLPLQTALDDGALATTTLRADVDVRTSSFEEEFFAGLLVQGTQRGVLREVARLVEAMDADPQTRGHYNFALLPRSGDDVRVVVFPRRADAVAVKADPLGEVKLGAFDLSGRGVLTRADLPPGSDDAFVHVAQRTVVRPSELPWLSTWGERPARDVVALRVLRRG